MAKQPNKFARADSSAGKSAVAVSGDPDTVAAAQPSTPKAEAIKPSVFADERSKLLADVRDMYDVAGQSLLALRRMLARRRKIGAM
jgi:hypothetical protein